jgi:hypothetical protein
LRVCIERVFPVFAYFSCVSPFFALHAKPTSHFAFFAAAAIAVAAVLIAGVVAAGVVVAAAVAAVLIAAVVVAAAVAVVAENSYSL